MPDYHRLVHSISPPIKLRPIQTWPIAQTPAHQREVGPFSADWKSTVTILAREIIKLHTRDVVIEFGYRDDDLRIDGYPRAHTKLWTPGIIINMVSREHGPLRIYHDGFTTIEANLRAIALHLENLRHASLYGVGRGSAQYAGWKQMPSADPSPASLTLEDALAYIVHHGGGPIGAKPADYLRSPDELRQLYRFAASRLHPDQPNGSHDAFVRLQAARDTMKAAGIAI